MTREEAIAFFKDMNECTYGNLEAVEMAIKALEQEPFDDAVSRKAVNTLVDELARAISDERCYMPRGRNTATIMQDILDLPSALPKREKGEWERGYSFPDGEYWKCSHCNELIKVKIPMHYCNNCGAEMRAKK